MKETHANLGSETHTETENLGSETHTDRSMHDGDDDGMCVFVCVYVCLCECVCVCVSVYVYVYVMCMCNVYVFEHVFTELDQQNQKSFLMFNRA